MNQAGFPEPDLHYPLTAQHDGEIMPFVPATDGVLLHYESVGKGQPIVLVHGWTMNGRFFKKNTDVLAERFRVITIDVRGHGLSGKEAIHLSMEQVGRDLGTVLAALDLHAVILAGWSMGMNAVYNYLSQFGTDRIVALVNIDMSPYLFVDDDWIHGVFGNMTPGSALATQRQLILDRTEVMSLFIPAMFAAGSVHAEHDLIWWTDQSTTVPDLTALALWVSFYGQDWRPLLPSITVPVLLVHGLKSQICPTPVWTALAKAIPATETILLEDSGHAPFWEEPDRFNSAVLAFGANL